MSAFDHTLSDGQSLAFDRAYHNELVAKLKALQQATSIRLHASTSRVQVHPDVSDDGDPTNDYPLQPHAVAVSDVTSWGMPDDAGTIKLFWSLESGPGHIETPDDPAPHQSLETAPGDTVFWSWDRGTDDSYYSTRPERDWRAVVDGSKLPAAATVRVQAKSLTIETDADPVARETDLEGLDSADGERRLVRSEGAVYQYDGPSDRWSLYQDVSPADYALISSASKSLVVERGYDPQVQPGITANIHPQQDVAYLSAEGEATITFDDYTTTGGDVTVSREVTGQLRGSEIGEDVTVSGPNTDPPNDFGSVVSNNQTFDVTATAPGVLLVHVRYDGGEQSTSTTRVVRVRPALDTSLGATTDPATPPVEAHAGRGEVQFKIGRTVTPQDIVTQGPVFGENAKNNWTNERARELTRRLGVEDLTDNDPQVQMLYEAGALLVSALNQPTENGLHRYRLNLPGGVGGPGQTLLFGDQGALRLEERVGGEASEGQAQRWQAVGFMETTASAGEAHLTGNGSVFEVEVRAAYGTVTDGGFPQDVTRRTLRTRPGQTGNQMTLPRRQPTKTTDRWYMSYRVIARWAEGREVQTNYTDWAPAEQLPSEPAEVEVDTENNGPVLHIASEGEPLGVAQWTRAGETSLDDDEVFGGSALPRHFPVSPAPQMWDGPQNPPHFQVKLVQTTEAGSARGQIESFDMEAGELSRQILPHTNVNGNSIPSDWPVVPGMLLSGDTRHWIGMPDEYVPIGGGASGLVDSIQVMVDGILYDATPDSPVEYTRDVAFYDADSVEVRLFTVGAVDNVQQLSTDLTLLQPQSSMTYNENAGFYTQSFAVPSGSYGADDRLLYRASSGPDRQIIDLTLTNSSIDNTSAPSVLRVDPLIDGAPDVSLNADRSASPELWTLQLNDGAYDWQGAFVTINTANLGTAELVSAEKTSGGSVNIAGENFQVRTGTAPQQVILHLQNADFSSSDVDIDVKLRVSNQNDAPERDIRLAIRQP